MGTVKNSMKVRKDSNFGKAQSKKVGHPTKRMDSKRAVKK